MIKAILWEQVKECEENLDKRRLNCGAAVEE